MLFRPWQSFATFIKSQNCRHFPCNISDFAALIMNRKFDYFPVNTWSLNALRLKEMDKNTMLEVFEQLDRLEGEDDGHLHQNRFLSLEATKQKLFCLLWSSQGFINEWLMSRDPRRDVYTEFFIKQIWRFGPGRHLGSTYCIAKVQHLVSW